MDCPQILCLTQRDRFSSGKSAENRSCDHSYKMNPRQCFVQCRRTPVASADEWRRRKNRKRCRCHIRRKCKYPHHLMEIIQLSVKLMPVGGIVPIRKVALADNKRRDKESHRQETADLMSGEHRPANT